MADDDVPVSREVGITRGAFEDDGGDAEEKGGVDDVGMTGDPADVTGAEEGVAVVDIEDVLSRRGDAE